MMVESALIPHALLSRRLTHCLLFVQSSLAAAVFPVHHFSIHPHRYKQRMIEFDTFTIVAVVVLVAALWQLGFAILCCLFLFLFLLLSR